MVNKRKKNKYTEESQTILFIQRSVVTTIKNLTDNPMSDFKTIINIKKSILRRGGYGGKNNPRWKGGIKNRTDGYIAIWKPKHPFSSKKGYIMEHILVMEKHLGRLIKLKEVIHHIDYNRSNNNIDNLHLFSSNGEHLKYHFYLRRLVKEALVV